MAMIQLNPQYEAIFDSRNIDEDCDKIADEINYVARMQIKRSMICTVLSIRCNGYMRTS